VRKRGKSALQDVQINDGALPHGATAAVKVAAADGAGEARAGKRAGYRGNHGQLRRIHVARVRAEDGGRVAPAKTVQRESGGLRDGMLVLPRAVSELAKRMRPAPRVTGNGSSDGRGNAAPE
jgi:hypothetical protein